MLGTGHALQTAVSAHPTWFDSPFLLSATDYIFPLSFFAALQARYVGTGADIVVSMKAVPPEELSGRSSVRFAGDLVVEEVVEKPAPGTAPSPYAANLIYILPAAIAAGLKEIEPSARGEYEIQTAVNVLIRRGMRARGLLQIPLPEWTPPAD